MLRHYSISQEVLGVSWGTNTHRLTTLSLTCIHPVSLSEARTWAQPSLVCPIVCFMQEGKSRRDCEKYRYWTGSASGTNNHSTNEHKTNRISPLGLLPTQNDESRNSQTSDRTGTTQRSTLSTTTDDNTDTQQLPWRVAKIINIHNLWSWILCQIQCQQLLTENQIPREILMTPSDKLNWVKNEGQLTCYLKISHDTEASWTLLHPLSLPWSPGLLLHTLPHAVVWESANQCFRISGMTLRQAAGPLLS